MKEIDTTRSYPETRHTQKSMVPKYLIVLSSLSFIIGVIALALAIDFTSKNLSQIQQLQNAYEELKEEDKDLDRDIKSVSSRASSNSRDISYLENNFYNLKREVGDLEDDFEQALGEGFVKQQTSWYQVFNGYEYKGLIYVQKNFTESIKSCHYEGAEIAIYGLQDWDTRRTIYKALELDKIDNPIWIGLNKTENDDWQWLNGDPATDEITFWSSKNESYGACAVLTSDDFYAAVKDCNEEMYVICERPVNPWG